MRYALRCARWNGRMRRPRLALVFLVVCCALAVIVDAKTFAAQLPPAGPFPDAVCNWDARMDIYIGPDGTLWECVCEQLQEGHACDWFEQGNVRANRLRRAARSRYHLRAIPRLVVIRL